MDNSNSKILLNRAIISQFGYNSVLDIGFLNVIIHQYSRYTKLVVISQQICYYKFIVNLALKCPKGPSQ